MTRSLKLTSCLLPWFVACSSSGDGAPATNLQGGVAGAGASQAGAAGNAQGGKAQGGTGGSGQSGSGGKAQAGSAQSGSGGTAQAGAGGSAQGGGGGKAQAGAGGAVTPPACSGASLSAATRVTPLASSSGASGNVVTSERPSGSAVAWSAGGKVHLTPLDAVDARAGADVVLDGDVVYGLVASDAGAAALFSRQPDYMTFVRVDWSGKELARVDLLGGKDHAVKGNEWFYEFAKTGRLARGEADGYVAYFALHRRWPDGIGHQGDTLRFLDADGKPKAGGWGWGCSHSMDLRLATLGASTGTICISDCYPDKGIFFQHDKVKITSDPKANCAGGFTTDLGGFVATQDGYFLSYTDAAGASHLAKLGADGKVAATTDLDVPDTRLARRGKGLLLGRGGGAVTLQALDASGAAVAPPEAVGASLPALDFESRSDGDVAWGFASGAGVSVVRVCD
ncbi:MAG: hypothetical protein IT374_10760 [Polyangiaceae bacterium]|nr:hypothetical protein [Polyangiaceae bacterium]